MKLLAHFSADPQSQSFNRHNLGLSGPNAETRALVEAWDWLSNNGLIAVAPGGDGWAYVTRRGKEVNDAQDGLALIRATRRLDMDLNPVIADRVRTQFLIGEYEQAAMIAMREVEIRVRDLGSFSPSDIGVALMRAAFKDGGPLCNAKLDAGETSATSALFAGAIGVFKNPVSHRQVDYDDPTFASEVVLLADLLLRMLDATEQRINEEEEYAFQKGLVDEQDL